MFDFLSADKLLLILVIILVLFGGKKLPELSKGLGEAMREFKKALSGDSDEKEKSKEGKKA